MASQKHCALLCAAVLCALISHSEGIIGGREATPHSRPYMASIQTGSSLKHECGGFVIADQWVMTAVHCFPNGADGKKVVLGVHSLSEAEDTKQTFDILQLHTHPDYSTFNYDNDIALIQLDRPFNASEAVQAVEYLRAGGINPEPAAEVVTAGWGSLNNHQHRPDKLHEVSVQVVRPGLCKRSDYFGAKITDNMMCAHRVCRRPCRKVEDSCDGDSGGPLLFNGTAVGITSNGGKKCGQSTKPGIYTVISHYTDWINSTMALKPTPAPTADTSH